MSTRGFEVSETIDRPVEAVWALMSDFRQMPDWMAEVEHIDIDGPGPPAPGLRLATRVKRSRTPLETEIVSWSPPHEMALRSRQGGICATYTYRCRPAASGTRVTLQASCRADGLLWRLLHPLIATMMKRADGGQVAALKALAERQS